MIERCDDPKCKGYKKQFVDRGYGYPVCPSNKWPLAPEDIKPMDMRYEDQYNTEYIIMHQTSKEISQI